MKYGVVKGLILGMVSFVIAGTFVYMGSLLKYPDNWIVGFAGIAFAFVFVLVLSFNTESPSY